MNIVSSDVTLDGFVIDGNNPSLTTSGTSQINGTGPYIDAHNGIDTLNGGGSGQAVNNLTVENNIVQNVAHDGIAFIDPSNGSSYSTGSVVTGNAVHNFGDYGILLAYNAYANVTYNTVVMPDNAEAGVWVYDFTSNGPSPQTINVTHNDVTVGQDAYRRHLGQSALSAATPPLNITDNTVNAGPGVTGTDGYTFGIDLSTVQNGMGVSLTGNTIGDSGGQFASGISLWNLPTTAGVSVSGGSIRQLCRWHRPSQRRCQFRLRQRQFHSRRQWRGHRRCHDRHPGQ